jgi:hypothetical protein
VAGNAAPHFRTENGTVIKLDQPIDTTAGPTFDHIHVAGAKVIGARVLNRAFANVPNSGDAGTDALIAALRDALIAHGLIGTTASGTIAAVSTITGAGTRIPYVP